MQAPGKRVASLDSVGCQPWGTPRVAIAHSSTKRLVSRSRNRSRNKWLPLSPPEKQALASPGSAPLLQPWREHAILRSLREQLQLCFDCWNLLDAPGGTSRRCVYLPPGAKEPDANYRNRVENARLFHDNLVERSRQSG